MATLNIYPVNKGRASYIVQINTDNLVESTNKSNGKPSGRKDDALTIVILDVSGSMGQNVRRVITDYLPNALENLKNIDNIHLITFSDRAKVVEHTIDSLKASTQGTEGCTYMTPAIDILGDLLGKNPNKNLRILTVSDGQLHDQGQTLRASNLVANFIKNTGQRVRSSAIRLITSFYSQPDTRGLASVMQFNTENDKSSTTIVDIQAGEARTKIIPVFQDLLTDDLNVSMSLTTSGSSENAETTDTETSSSGIFLEYPWGNVSKEIRLKSGENTFWMNSIPDKPLKLSIGHESATTVNVQEGGTLNFGSFNTILKEKVNYFFEKLKVLKVIGTEDAQKEIQEIISYFKQLEKYFTLNDNTDTAEVLSYQNLNQRLKFFKDAAQKKSRSIVNKLSEFANDDKVSKLNSAQQADYLRSATLSLNSKNLAKRAIKNGLDFDTIARNEVKAMNDHLKELDGINDDDHYSSFYSQETTLGGIKAVCELVDENNTLDQMNCVEILQLLNVVGIPCRGPVGDFPDPKTYHPDELMLGFFVSMADIMIVKDSGNTLTEPYNKEEIINVIPFYDDDRIQQFLMKYAPTLLEYTASVGMRNMIVDVPHTYKYTIVGGLWNMAQRLDSEKSNANADVFVKLVKTYQTAVDHIFDYVVPLFKQQSEEDKNNNLSFYISNNGTTNMVSPLIDVMEEVHKNAENNSRAQFLPAALRALYSFEFHQVIRKFHKSDSDGQAKRKAMLDEILGIDFSKYATALPDYFEPSVNPVFFDKPVVNEDALHLITDKVHWVDKITYLPHYFLNSFKGEEGIKSILETSCTDEENIKKALNIDFDLQAFKLYCIAQSFLFPTKLARVDNDNHKMKIEDCGNQERMTSMLGDYIRQQYKSQYQSELSKRRKEEHQMLTDELVEKMCLTEDMDEFVNYFRNGLQRGENNLVNAHIGDTYKLGFTDLRDRMFDKSAVVNKRPEKIWIFIMGTTPGNNAKVWNNGNVLRMSLRKLESILQGVDCQEVYDKMHEEYKEKNIHAYRDSDKPNRHTHCNSKASYWAFGFPTIGAYFAEISEEEQKEYMAIHTHCCGIWDGKLTRTA